MFAKLEASTSVPNATLAPRHILKFSDIPVTPNFVGAQPANLESAINGHDVENGTIAMQAPLDSDHYRANLARLLVTFPACLIVDLTKLSDERPNQGSNYRRKNLEANHGGIQTSFEQAGPLTQQGLPSPDATFVGVDVSVAEGGRRSRKRIECLNVPTPDGQGASPRWLFDTVDFISRWRSAHAGQQNATVVVHCTAGVGRTGMLIAAERMTQLWKADELKPEAQAMQDQVFDIIRDLRNRRAPHMVQKPEQLKALMAYGADLVARQFGEPSRPPPALPPRKPKPKPIAGGGTPSPTTDIEALRPVPAPRSKPAPPSAPQLRTPSIRPDKRREAGDFDTAEIERELANLHSTIGRSRSDPQPQAAARTTTARGIIIDSAKYTAPPIATPKNQP